MTRNEYKLHRLLGDIELMQQPFKGIVEGHADTIRRMIHEAGKDRHLVFVALALVSAETLASFDGTQ